jgi:hypothetical protein
MPLEWMKNFRKEESNKNEDDDIEIKPGEVKAKLDKIDGIETGLNSFKTEVTNKLKGLDSIVEYVNESKDRRDKEDQARKDAIERKRQKEIDDDTPVLEDDANRAVDAKINPIILENRRLSASNKVREMIDDNQLEFYTGDVKQHMNRLIEDSIKAGTVPTEQFLKNCYYVAVGENQEKITTGKIKSRFSAISANNSGTGATSEKQDDTIELSDQQKKMAAIFGMKPEDYAKGLKKEVEGEYNYV